ncbi:SubName: Full=Related to DCR2-dosage-dependent cell cycle regulator {ECO:0000313/EMBL:CCA72678.1} [Serendipita indica DSM 11827]|nr:SubName: Full=Related to DCR2-dosage-dependent cell cycle regulator {ECO:0000313/EMBL:CCA72678.1} [Serendipita indica DSM 11827]
MSFKGLIFPVTTFVGFAIVLSFVQVLYKPSAGPTKAQRIGWQEWDLVYFGEATAQDKPRPTPNNTNGVEDTSTDWWNTPDDSQDWTGSSLPLDQWLPLQPHDTGLTEIALTRCFVDHAYGFCYPDSTPEQDRYASLKFGKWTRVERDVQAKTSIYYLSFYYRRTRRLDVPLITDLKLLAKGEENTLPNLSEWRGVAHSVRDGVMGQPALFLWYKLGPPMSQMDLVDVEHMVTEIDILNGEGRPFYGFEKLSPPLATGRAGQSEDVHLVYRRGIKNPPRAKPLHFSHSGHFKIMQVADLHFSVSHGQCKDTDLTPCEQGDDMSLALLERTLDLERPDLVVFSGDQLNGQGTSWDPRSVLAKFAGPVIDRGIAWAAVLGNHDEDDGDLTRTELIKVMRNMPYSLVELGPSDVHGAGNYVLKVRSPDPSRTQLLTLYFLDSGSYSAGVWDWFGFTPTEYDYLRQSQIDWFLHESSLVSKLERPWHPDGGRDLGHSWRRSTQGKRRQEEQRKLLKPNAMMFYHIPIPETYSTADIDYSSNQALEIGTPAGKGSPKKNDGFFEKALLNATESEQGGREVKVVANGHVHIADNCRRVLGIWFCFNGGSSYSGYGKVGFDRRFRIFNITDWGETITTYERTEKGKLVDPIVLVGNGGPSPYDG